MPACVLLVTQRITKYPVLVERIIKNTEGKCKLVFGSKYILDYFSFFAHISFCYMFKN